MANYSKLDWDWRRDPKVRKLRALHGKAMLADLPQLFILMGVHCGRVDLNDVGDELDATDRMEMSRERLDAYLAKCAECGIIDADMLQMGIVTSNRAVMDANVRTSRAESAKAASEAAAQKRREQRGDP